MPPFRLLRNAHWPLPQSAGTSRKRLSRKSRPLAVLRPYIKKSPENTFFNKQSIEIKTEEDLIGPGAAPGTVPTDFEQATGLERLEILGKMEGVDVFDMKPLDASRRGTMENPIVVQSFGEER